MKKRSFFICITLFIFFSISCCSNDVNDKQSDQIQNREITDKFPDKLDKSFKDIAYDHWKEKDYLKAIEFYHKFLMADPKDKTAWFFLARSYALMNDTEKALKALEKSFSAGFDEYESTLKNEDLKILWEDKRFIGLVEKERTKNRDSVPENYKRHFLAIKNIGTYIVMLPPDYQDSGKSYPLCVILHGMGSSELTHGKASDIFGREDVIYIAPRAPNPDVEGILQIKKAGWTLWYPDKVEDETLDPIRVYVDWIFSCVDDAFQHYRIAGDKVFIWGHSEGAAIANVCASIYPQRIHSYLSYAAFFLEHIVNQDTYKKIKENDVKIFLVHGIKDEVIESKASEKVYNEMQLHGVDVTLKLLDCNHNFSTNKVVQDYSKKWVDENVRTQIKNK